MDRVRGSGPAFRRAGSLALITGLVGFAGLVLAGCQATSAASPATPSEGGVSASAGTSSPSPGLSVPGTHRATTTYQISSPVSTVVVVGHVGNATVTDANGPAISVTQQADYSKTPPVTTRTWARPP